MTHKVSVKIVTLEKTIYENEVDSITLPTRAGVITVLGNHEPLIGVITPGMLVLTHQGTTTALAVTGGFFEVKYPSNMIILADTAERISEMNIEEIEKAKARVEHLLKEEQHISDIEFAHLEEILARETSRIELARKHRKHIK